MFKTAYNSTPCKGGTYSGIKSKAVPDEAYTLRDMITQFASGVREFEEIVGLHDENPTFDEVSPLNNRGFDLADFTAEQLAIAERHIAFEREKKEKEAFVAELSRQEAARQEAITEVASE